MRRRPLIQPAPFLLVVLGLGAVLYQGCTTRPRPVDHFPDYPVGFVERGMASWYGPGFHGNKTANGERYDMYALTAAHRTLPLGSVAVVHSLTSGHHVKVRINDRGPFAKGRILDLSLAGAQALGMTGNGTDRVELRVVGYDPRPEGMGVLRVQVGSFADFTMHGLWLLGSSMTFPMGVSSKQISLKGGDIVSRSVGSWLSRRPRRLQRVLIECFISSLSLCGMMGRWWRATAADGEARPSLFDK